MIGSDAKCSTFIFSLFYLYIHLFQLYYAYFCLSFKTFKISIYNQLLIMHLLCLPTTPGRMQHINRFNNNNCELITDTFLSDTFIMSCLVKKMQLYTKKWS